MKLYIIYFILCNKLDKMASRLGNFRGSSVKSRKSGYRKFQANHSNRDFAIVNFRYFSHRGRATARNSDNPISRKMSRKEKKNVVVDGRILANTS